MLNMVICPSDKFTKKLVFGRAQFGSNYDVTNREGRRQTSEPMEILELVWEFGMRTFDTAPTYGSARMLGEFIVRNILFVSGHVGAKLSKMI